MAKCHYLTPKNTRCNISLVIRVQEASGSNPDTPTKKYRIAFAIRYFLFWSCVGIRKAVKKTCRWHVFRPWENPWKADGTLQGVLAAFHLWVHSASRLCIVSTYSSFARKDTRLDTISSLVFLFYVGMIPGMGYCSNFFRCIGFGGGKMPCQIGE